MTEYRFTTEQAMEAMRKAVELKGSDYVYPESEKDGLGTCFYAHDGQPSCIVGHVINILDPEAFKNLAAVELEHGAQGVTDLAFDSDYPYLSDGFWSPHTAEVMAVAQARQDQDHSWGDALAYAEDNV